MWYNLNVVQEKKSNEKYLWGKNYLWGRISEFVE